MTNLLKTTVLLTFLLLTIFSCNEEAEVLKTSNEELHQQLIAYFESADFQIIQNTDGFSVGNVSPNNHNEIIIDIQNILIHNGYNDIDLSEHMIDLSNARVLGCWSEWEFKWWSNGAMTISTCSTCTPSGELMCTLEIIL